jgi:hypothetical protein
MENRLTLRVGTSGRIRLKGQMKFIEAQNMLWFLCHPVWVAGQTMHRIDRIVLCRLGSADDMISAGLHLNDLNVFDSTSDLLITALQQERAIEEAIEKVELLAIEPLDLVWRIVLATSLDP